MKKLLVTLLIFTAFGAHVALAQKIRIIEGDFSALKGQKMLNAKYDYSNMGVGSFEKEEDYVAKKTTDYNAKEKGKGDNWALQWVGDRKNNFEPKFEELFVKTCMELGNHPEAKYTLIIHTTFTEPGFNVYVTRKNASISGEVWLVETADQSKALCKLKFEKAPGRTFGGNDYDTGTRISESYAKAGKEIGKFIAEKLEK